MVIVILLNSAFQCQDLPPYSRNYGAFLACLHPAFSVTDMPDIVIAVLNLLLDLRLPTFQRLLVRPFC